MAGGTGPSAITDGECDITGGSGEITSREYTGDGGLLHLVDLNKRADRTVTHRGSKLPMQIRGGFDPSGDKDRVPRDEPSANKLHSFKRALMRGESRHGLLFDPHSATLDPSSRFSIKAGGTISE